jgi:hypothetical protein
MVPTTVTQDFSCKSSEEPFRNHSIRQGSSGARNSGDAVRDATDVFIFGLNTEIVSVKLENYFDGHGPERGCDLLKCWNSEADRDSEPFDIAKTAWLILQIPASESASECAFAFLQTLFPRYQTGCNDKLLEAELRIRLG